MHLSLLHTHTSPGYRWGRIKRYRKWWNPGGTEALPHLGSVCGLSPAVKQQSTTTSAFLPSQWEACNFSRNLTRNLICRKSLHPKPRCSSGGSWFHLIRCEACQSTLLSGLWQWTERGMRFLSNPLRCNLRATKIVHMASAMASSPRVSPESPYLHMDMSY